MLQGGPVFRNSCVYIQLAVMKVAVKISPNKISVDPLLPGGKLKSQSKFYISAISQLAGSITMRYNSTKILHKASHEALL